MAQTIVKVVLHPQAFSQGNILTQINPAVVHNVNLGGSTQGSAGWGLTGAGQGLILGAALNPCLINVAPPPGPPPATTALDPPVIYTFCNATSPYGRDFLNLNLKMIRGNDYSFNIQVIQNGNSVSLTGGTLRMTAKWNVTDTDANAVFSVYSPSNGISFISAVAGTATVTIASSLTNMASIPFHRIDLPYSIDLTTAAGQKFTVMYGTLTVLPDANRTYP